MQYLTRITDANEVVGGHFLWKLPPGYYYGFQVKLSGNAQVHQTNASVYHSFSLTDQKEQTNNTPTILSADIWTLGKTDTFAAMIYKDCPILPHPIYLQNPHLHYYSSNSASFDICVFYEKTVKRYEK